MKKTLLILTAILTTTMLVGCFERDNNTNINDNQQNNNSINNVENNETNVAYIKGEKILEQVTFSDIKITKQGEDQYLLTATVTNNSSGDIMSKVLEIELFRENNQSIGIVGGILPDISALGTATIEVPIALNVLDTKDIEIRYTEN